MCSIILLPDVTNLHHKQKSGCYTLSAQGACFLLHTSNGCIMSLTKAFKFCKTKTAATTILCFILTSKNVKELTTIATVQYCYSIEFEKTTYFMHILYPDLHT